MSLQDHAGAKPSRDLDDFPLIWFEAAGEFLDPEIEAMIAKEKILSLGTTPVDQKDIPCCVSVALTAAMQFVGSTPPLAPLFNYFLSRTNPAVIDDIEIAHAFRSAMNKGICNATLHPLSFDTSSALTSPSQAALAEARNRRLVPTMAGQPSFRRVKVDESQWKGAIDRSLPVLMGFFMSPEYKSILQRATLVHDRPTSLGNGHACLVIGYSDAKQEFTIRDARGPGVGVAGTWQLPYSRLADGLIFESWVVTAVP